MITALPTRPTGPDYLTARQVARALDVSDDTVYRMAQSGELPNYRVGNGRGRLRFPLNEFRDYLRANNLPAALAGLVNQSPRDLRQSAG